jgi:hypothetical protein
LIVGCINPKLPGERSSFGARVQISTRDYGYRYLAIARIPDLEISLFELNAQGYGLAQWHLKRAPNLLRRSLLETRPDDRNDYHEANLYKSHT